ncbi:hypothetical protein AVEN_195631-1 [Araneus ventricosus]|uniref:Uncharacterized protein n=1 Tax=Araneus ventricosus TaxID=182803 RepID=A0A4Y2BBC1_ARAVE|nr:hypothetical protein AVEN_195631-1 [Araneus ventricosus]
MCIMEGKTQGKGKIEDIRTELHGTNHILRRPKNFSFQRRSDVYFFSGKSAKGILKRVPVKNGSYRLDEQETVLEKSDAANIRNGIWSDEPLNSPGSSKTDKNGTDAKKRRFI